MRHLWCHDDGRGFESGPVITCGISEMSTVLLIDWKGKILCRGRPASADLEVTIDELLSPREDKKNPTYLMC